MYHLLFYKLVPDYLERRGSYRAEHLAMAQKLQQSGTIVMAGALSDPADGAVFIFKGDDGKAAAEAFAKADPYVVNGLITEWYVRPWTVVIGG